MGIPPESGHPALSRRIFSTCFAARSIARRTSPRFASSYTRATRSASSPAPRLRSFPSSDSMIARTNRPWSSWIVAISEVPTIAAVIAATIFGSTPSGRVCVTTRPSRRTTDAEEEETHVRLVPDHCDEDRLLARTGRDHLADVRVHDGRVECSEAHLDDGHLRRADDRGGHRGDLLRVHRLREGVRD